VLDVTVLDVTVTVTAKKAAAAAVAATAITEIARSSRRQLLTILFTAEVGPVSATLGCRHGRLDRR
jgi:hypothetical protein